MKKVVIDAGHGGSDGGAVGNGIVEKDLNLEISKYMHERLDELGIENTLLRDSDITIGPNDRVKKAVEPYGSSNDVLIISNHINAGGGQGAEIIYALRDSDTFSKNCFHVFRSPICYDLMPNACAHTSYLNYTT